MLKLRSWWSWFVELKIKLLKVTGKQCWHWDRFVELGIKLLVLIRIFIVEFCYNLATILWLGRYRDTKCYFNQWALYVGWGGHSQESWVGMCGSFPKTLTLFMTKICDFWYFIHDLAKNWIPCGWHCHPSYKVMKGVLLTAYWQWWKSSFVKETYTIQD